MGRGNKPPNITARALGKNLPKLVEAYACGQCANVYLLSGDAASCCTCRTCGVKFQKASIYSQCSHCSHGARLRETRADVRRTEEHLEHVKARLATLLAMKRPPKGTAP